MNAKILLIVVFITSSITVNAAIPKVTLSYADMYDAACTAQTKYIIEKKWVEELTKRLPEFQAAWQSSGARLLRTTEAIIGKDFAVKEFAAALSLCSFPSMSNPLTINMRYSLKSFIPQPLSVDVTISIIFHEILHRYLNDKMPTESKLLMKYKNEDETVLNHIHLLALLKSVYLKLKQEQILQDVILKDQSLPNKSYTRAWEIVNKVEDYKSFINELKF